MKRLHSQVAISTLDLNLERETTPGPLGVATKSTGWVVNKLFVWKEGEDQWQERSERTTQSR